MKKLKRISSLLLAVMLIMAMNLLAVAADSSVDFGDKDYAGKIVIHKYDTSDYEDYKPGEGDGTKLEPADKIGEDGKGRGITIGELKTLANIPFTIEKVRIMTEKEAEEAFGTGAVNPADPKYYVLVTGTSIDGKVQYVTDSNGEINFTGLPKGIYRITEVNNTTTTSIVDPFLITLPMTDPADSTGRTTLNEVHVYPKNTGHLDPVVSKEVTNLTVNDNKYNGRVIEWTIASEVPGTITGSAAAADVEKYVLTDTFGDYLTYQSDSLQVYYMKTNGTKVDLTLTEDYTVDTSTNKTVKITLTQAGRAKLADAIAAAGEEQITGDDSRNYLLYLKYKTTVTITDDQWLELISDKDKLNITNEIVLDFTNDSGTSYHSEDTSAPDLYQIKIHKYDGAMSTDLAGAKFKIYTALKDDSTPNPSTVLKDEATGNEVEVVTEASGLAYFNGLPKGTYYIVETAAPEGYNLNSTPIKVVISSDDKEVPVYSTVTSEIPNYNNFTLPTTGGTGTMLFTIGGMILIAAAGFIYFASRKKNDRQK